MRPITRGAGYGLQLGAFAVVIWLSALVEVWRSDRYHSLDTQLNNYGWLAILLIITLVEWGVRVIRKLPFAPLAARAFFSAVALWGWIVLFNGAQGYQFRRDATLAVMLWLGLLVLGRPWLWRLTPGWPPRLPLALAVGCALFVAFPAAMAALRAHDLAWPPSALGSADRSVAQASRPTVLILLFDELNAISAAPIQAALAEEGLQVSSRAVRPVGDSTAKVIPAMWTRESFDQAKPCNTTSICSGARILDFSRVSASRDDVDVVGFYHPYCAMQGLRYCQRASTPGILEEPTRIGCAIRSRLGMDLPQDCRARQHAHWSALSSKLEQAYWAAPFWHRRGLMFAHLSYPHPPALDAGATLREHYASGVARAAALARRSVRLMKANGVSDLRVIVASDHPLRVPLWCGNGTYSARRCEGADTLLDTEVPLIVGTTSDPVSLERYETNAQLFDLVADVNL